MEFEDLRQQNVPFDFEIKVRETSFFVHRKTIITHSVHFQAKLANDTKEEERVYVEENDLKLEIVEKCIESMYTGKVTLTISTAEDIYQLGRKWELWKIQDECIDFWTKNLNSRNFVSILNIAKNIHCWELEVAAEQICKEELKKRFFEILELPKDDFAKFLKTHNIGNEVAWEVIVNWIKRDSEKRSEFLFEFVELINWEDFPSAELLEKLWKESLIRNDSKCREFLFEKLFLDLESFNSNLNLENIFILKRLSNDLKHVIQEVNDSVIKFLKTNFLLLSNQPGFKNLNAEEFIEIFTGDASRGLVSEKSRWNAMMTWIKHDRSREAYFPALVKSIKFDRLPKRFLESIVRNELTVDRGCSKMIIDALFCRVMLKKEKAFVAVLYSDGRIRALNVVTKSWKDLAKLPEPVDNAEIFYFNGKLCVINGSKLFYLQDDDWIERSAMNLEMSKEKMVTTHGDFIYVVCNAIKSMFCYNSLTDCWNEVQLPSDITSISSMAATDEYVYVHMDNKDWKYTVKTKGWKSRTLEYIISDLRLFVLDNELYSCRGYGEVSQYDLGQSSCWTAIKDQQSECSRRGLYLSSSSSPVNIDGKPVIVECREIRIYDKLSRKWELICEIPVFVSGVEGQDLTSIGMVSACSYYQDPVTNSS